MTPAEWKRRLQDSTDYFHFVSEAAIAALAGDGRAALLVSEILPKCQLFKLQYAKAADPWAAFEDYLATLPGRTPAGDGFQRQEFDRCQRFLTDDPLRHLQLGAEGSTSPYWRRLAEQNNDPVARSQHAITQRARSASNDPAGFLDTVRSDLAVVIPSQDTEALYNAGVLLVDTRVSKDPLRGVAWMIVAMETGYDGPHLNFPLCGEFGPCPGTADFIATLQRDIGMERYARADAQAQEIKELMAREDWAALERYWMPDVPSR
jgi:hypothetical protein